MVDRELLDRLTQELTDRGKLIEAGWLGLRFTAIEDEDASHVQLEEMRMSFFAGAAHLFNTLVINVESGAKTKKSDIKRISLIDAELREFRDQIALRTTVTKGSA